MLLHRGLVRLHRLAFQLVHRPGLAEGELLLLRVRHQPVVGRPVIIHDHRRQLLHAGALGVLLRQGPHHDLVLIGVVEALQERLLVRRDRRPPLLGHPHRGGRLGRSAGPRLLRFRNGRDQHRATQDCLDRTVHVSPLVTCWMVSCWRTMLATGFASRYWRGGRLRSRQSTPGDVTDLTLSSVAGACSAPERDRLEWSSSR
jgi:hypothetical protein